MPSLSRAGSWSGSGGSGDAYEFLAMAELLARFSILEDYKPNEYQMRDQVDMPTFWAALNHVKVVATHEPLRDRDGDPQTALFFTPDEIRQQPGRFQWDEKKFPLGLIEFNIERFNKEKDEGLHVALATVFHEIARAMKLPEDHYEKVRQTFNSERMLALLNSNLPLVQALRENQSRVGKMRSKLELVDSEEKRVLTELDRDQQKLDVVIVKRRPFVKAQREAVENMFNAMSSLIASTSMMAPMSRMETARLVKKSGALFSGSIDLQYKMNELEVMNEQVDFLSAVLRENRDFYLELMQKRKKIVLEALDE